jgi:non-ribosomal peptide synthetase component F
VDDLDKLETLRIISSGGEKLTDELFNKLKKTDKRIINRYGSTETTIVSLVNNNSQDNNIGRPISNMKAYILDNNHQLLPIEEVGELCTSGVGLSKGYLNNLELNEEKFILNPYSQTTWDKYLYKTGDLVRYINIGG